MNRALLMAVSAAVGAVAGYFVPKLVACCQSGAPTLLPFPNCRPQRQHRRAQVAGLQPSNNGPDGGDHDDR